MPSIVHEVSLIFTEVRSARPTFIEFLKSCDNLQYQTKIFAAKGRDTANMITAVAKLQMSPEIGAKYTRFGQDLQEIFNSFDNMVYLLHIHHFISLYIRLFYFIFIYYHFSIKSTPTLQYSANLHHSRHFVFIDFALPEEIPLRATQLHHQRIIY